MKPSPTHDEDMAILEAYMKRKYPMLEPHTKMWTVVADLERLGYPEFPQNTAYLLDKPLTSLEMKERADRVYGSAYHRWLATEIEDGRIDPEDRY